MKLRIKGFKLTAGNVWDAQQVRMFCESAIKNIGGEGAWNILSKPLRKAVVAQEAFSVVRSVHRSSSPSLGAMNALLNDMERLLDLSEFEDEE
jgi:hypothetical protein